MAHRAYSFSDSQSSTTAGEDDDDEALNSLHHLLQIHYIPIPIDTLQDCTPTLWLALFESIFQTRLPDIIRQTQPLTLSQKLHNTRLLLSALESDVLHMPLDDALNAGDLCLRHRESIVEMINVLAAVERVMAKKRPLATTAAATARAAHSRRNTTVSTTARLPSVARPSTRPAPTPITTTWTPAQPPQLAPHSPPLRADNNDEWSSTGTPIDTASIDYIEYSRDSLPLSERGVTADAEDPAVAEFRARMTPSEGSGSLRSGSGDEAPAPFVSNRFFDPSAAIRREEQRGRARAVSQPVPRAIASSSASKDTPRQPLPVVTPSARQDDVASLQTPYNNLQTPFNINTSRSSSALDPDSFRRRVRTIGRTIYDQDDGWLVPNEQAYLYQQQQEVLRHIVVPAGVREEEEEEILEARQETLQEGDEEDEDIAYRSRWIAGLMDGEMNDIGEQEGQRGEKEERQRDKLVTGNEGGRRVLIRAEDELSGKDAAGGVTGRDVGGSAAAPLAAPTFDQRQAVGKANRTEQERTLPRIDTTRREPATTRIVPPTTTQQTLPLPQQPRKDTRQLGPPLPPPQQPRKDARQSEPPPPPPQQPRRDARQQEPPLPPPQLRRNARQREPLLPPPQQPRKDARQPDTLLTRHTTHSMRDDVDEFVSARGERVRREPVTTVSVGSRDGETSQSDGQKTPTAVDDAISRVGVFNFIPCFYSNRNT